MTRQGAEGAFGALNSSEKWSHVYIHSEKIHQVVQL